MARRGKTWYKDVVAVDTDTDTYLYRLQDMLKGKTYRTSQYEVFKIFDKGKEREISKLPYFPDRICQWAIMLQIEDTLVKNFIGNTYASIPGRGIHLAVKRIKKAMTDKEGTCYCLKFDVKKYFPTIDHEILKAMLRKKFKDEDLLWLLDEIIDSVDSGLPIGNYLSQYLANFYLSYFDHWMKEVKKCRHYYRYMDDVVVLHHSKRWLHRLKFDVEDYLSQRLNIVLKADWQIFPARIRGIDFAGYRVFGEYILLRKRIARSIKIMVSGLRDKEITEHDINSIMSYLGWLCYCNGYNFIRVHIHPLIRRLVKDERIHVPRRRQRTRLCLIEAWRKES